MRLSKLAFDPVVRTELSRSSGLSLIGEGDGDERIAALDPLFHFRRDQAAAQMLARDRTKVMAFDERLYVLGDFPVRIVEVKREECGLHDF